MNKRTWIVAAAAASFAAGIAYAQFPIMDKVADKVIQKYQTSTCEQLWQEKAQSRASRSRRWSSGPSGAETRSADAPGVLQQGLGAHRQQDVRVRDDSLMPHVDRRGGWSLR